MYMLGLCDYGLKYITLISLCLLTRITWCQEWDKSKRGVIKVQSTFIRRLNAGYRCLETNKKSAKSFEYFYRHFEF
jgi:hypothetical protein